MELISIGFVQNLVTNQYGKHKNLRIKIDKYFAQFVDRYNDFNYVWHDKKPYIEAKHEDQIKKDIEKMLNKQIQHFRPKEFPPEFNPRFIDAVSVKRKITRKINRKRRLQENRKRKIRNNFNKVVNGIKQFKEGHNYIGSFDLEFWEHNMNHLLEFGWRIEDYYGSEGETVHLIVQENLHYENGVFSKNNRFARKDSQIVPLKVALKRFKEEFVDKIDILVGHGLSNDFKVLKINGMNLQMDYLDTSDIGGVMMNQNDKVSLERLLDHLKIKHDDLHNAANDVEFILKAFFNLGDL
jgi:hypothetical protein